jgi:hypothetical protein
MIELVHDRPAAAEHFRCGMPRVFDLEHADGVPADRTAIVPTQHLAEGGIVGKRRAGLKTRLYG